jgi:hypothetical protein
MAAGKPTTSGETSDAFPASARMAAGKPTTSGETLTAEPLTAIR